MNSSFHFDDSFHTADEGSSICSGSYVTAQGQRQDIAQMADVDTIESLGFEDIDLKLGDAGPTYQEQVDIYRRSRRGSPVPDRAASSSRDAEDIIQRGLFNPDFDPTAVWSTQVQPAASLPNSTPPPPWDPAADVGGFFAPRVWAATAGQQVADYRRRQARAWRADPAVGCWEQYWSAVERLVQAAAPVVEQIGH